MTSTGALSEFNLFDTKNREWREWVSWVSTMSCVSGVSLAEGIVHGAVKINCPVAWCNRLHREIQDIIRVIHDVTLLNTENRKRHR